nr:PAN domain-containing protein [Hyphomonas sp. Mor2]
MRFVPVLIAAACLTLPAGATKPTPESPPTTPDALDLAGAPLVVRENTYRFGALLRSEPGTSVDACAAACHADARCQAWTLTPAAYSAEARCELKSNPGASSYRPGAVSGISESLRMQPEMRYQVSVPEGYQPAPVEELEGAPVDAAKAESAPMKRAESKPPKALPDLLGTTETRVSAVMRQPAPPAAPIPPASPAEQVWPAPPMTPVAPLVPVKAASATPAPSTEPAERVIRISDAPEAVATPITPAEPGAPIMFKLTAPKPVPAATPATASAPSVKSEAIEEATPPAAPASSR